MDINLLDNTTLQQLRQTIDDCRNVVVCCHKSPDGDAIGSSLAIADYLRQKGKTVNVCIPDAFPDFLKWLKGTKGILRFDWHKDRIANLMANADTIFCMDFNSPSRLDSMEPLLVNSKARKVLIDHHLSPDIDATPLLSFPQMCSTCELLFRLLWQLGEYDNITREMTEALYCGMMTDTGGFTYASTRPEIYYIISLMLAKGIDKDLIFKYVFHNYSADCIRLRGYVMNEKLNVIDSLHASYYSVTKEEMKRFNFKKGDLEGLVNEPLRIKGHKLSISLREDTEKPNLTHVSLRSAWGFHCAEMATKFFNGGGHDDAAGGRLFCGIEEAENIALKAILAYKDLLIS
ncbi:MAG: DHH family phosphoesterase [Prevotella sp.]|nr:DHH family phosphoesterase [Prevotella sp.]